MPTDRIMTDSGADLAEIASFIPAHTKQVQEVLAHPEIKALAARFPGQAERLRHCIEGLSGAGPAETETLVQATKKAFDAITGKLRVFLSYKRAQHKKVAELLRESLQGFGGSKIEVFLDEVKIEAGQDWFNSTKKSIRSANCLVLLVPDDSDEREWPIFEAAFFAGRMLPGERLICLHHPAAHMPRQLAAFQGYMADAAGVERLLRRLLVEPEVLPGLDAINPHCGRFLEEFVRRIVAAFSGPVQLRSRRTTNFISLELRNPHQFSDEQDLLTSNIIAADGLDDMFFYSGDLPCQFQRALGAQDSIAGRHGIWLAELFESIRAALTHRRGEVSLSPFSTPDGKQFFTPVLREVQEDVDGNIFRLEIIFHSAKDAIMRAIFGSPVTGKWPQIFMLMPFTEELKPVFDDHVARVSSELGLSCGRADDFFSTRSVMQEVWSAIYHSEIIIADCTGRNPNVFYEIGIAHTIGKPTILVSQNIEDIPFDVRHIRTIVYRYTPRGMEDFERKLVATITTVREAK